MGRQSTTSDQERAGTGIAPIRQAVGDLRRACRRYLNEGGLALAQSTPALTGEQRGEVVEPVFVQSQKKVASISGQALDGSFFHLPVGLLAFDTVVQALLCTSLGFLGFCLFCQSSLLKHVKVRCGHGDAGKCAQ